MGRKVIEDERGDIKIVSDGIIEKSKNIADMLMFKQREKKELFEGIKEKIYSIVSWMMGKD